MEEGGRSRWRLPLKTWEGRVQAMMLMVSGGILQVYQVVIDSTLDSETLHALKDAPVGS